ncbi:MAG: hypothetical protein ABI874_02485, partial [Chloroflexota bacterium]
MNGDWLVAWLHIVGGALTFMYARHKRVAAGQWFGAGALVLGAALFVSTNVFSAPPPRHVTLAADASPLPPAAATRPLSPARDDLYPQALLAQSDSAMNRLRSVTMVQHLFGSSGQGVTATFEYLAPDKLHYKVTNGLESVAIGGAQYYLETGSGWEKVERATPLRWPNFDYVNGVSDATLEGEEMMDGEMSAVVTFKAPKVDLYRHWIGLTT